MNKKVHLGYEQLSEFAKNLVPAVAILRSKLGEARYLRCYAVPRGGVPAALLLSRFLRIELVEHPEEADFFMDDIIDSGNTMERLCDAYPGVPFLALIDKLDKSLPQELRDAWLVFPWEREGGQEETIEDNIRRLLQAIGENPARSGLLETPHRVAKAWRAWTAGYTQDPAAVLKTFEDGAEHCDEMVMVKDIPFFSHCEHHMAPFFGTATIAYLPDKKIVGLSKLSRLLDVFARRLQVQERLTAQVAEALMENLRPRGVGVVVKARHLCMESRGVAKQGHHTVTSSMLGAFRDDSRVRAEFLDLAK